MRKLSFLAVIAVLAFGCDGDGGTSDSGIPGTDSGTTDGGTDSGTPPPTCVDGDSDGYGQGCTLGADCNDGDATISPAASEVCDGVDNNCDGMTDEGVMGAACELTEGVCAGATERCDAGSLVCDETSYGATYEADETLCDGLDNDCDGTTDEDCSCTEGETQNCGSDLGVCEAGTQTCQADLTWGPCVDEVGPMGESCDGLDNDCDEETDEPGELTAPDCALQQGVCAGSKRACGGTDGWLDCAGTESYGAMYEETEASCDGVDNDCNGIVDDGCECTEGATQACGSAIGACMEGTQTCTAGAFGACAGEVTPVEETCDGVDQDCDGDTDEDVVATECALRIGVCAGATATCEGASGFGACGAAEYGSLYEETESLCDGQDNDCDGDVDETCACVDGETQECGLSTGACTRGTQTCVAGAFGACTGGIEPAAEDCDGVDNDCNGTTDDNLTAPACALIQGVCGGSTQVCGGAAGWTACAGTDSYGPNFVTTEDGAGNELLCDGLDNDCDGVVDDDCGSGPLLPRAEDVAFPTIDQQTFVYSVNVDGNWDVFVSDFTTGVTRRLTTTPQDEIRARVRGNHVVYQRQASDGAVTSLRAVVYDLETDTETVLSTVPSSSPDISGGLVVFDQLNAGQWDIMRHQLADGSTGQLLVGVDTTDEELPAIRNGRIAFAQRTAGTGPYTIRVATLGVGVETAPSASGQGHLTPFLDTRNVGWTDGRVAADLDFTGAWDVFVSDMSSASGDPATYVEQALVNAGSGQVLSGIDSGVFVWADFRNGNWDPVFSLDADGSSETFLTSSPAAQIQPEVSGNIIMWADNRLGSFDIYSSVLPNYFADPLAGTLIISEVLADPPAGDDVNGDGVANIDSDEFVEIINLAPIPVRLDGMELLDATGVQHVFAPGTIIPALGRIIVFGDVALGAESRPNLNGLFGGAQVVPSSTGSLELNNGGDTVTLQTAGGALVVDTFTYSLSNGNINQSMVRENDSAGDPVQHTTLNASRPYSLGLTPQGFGF